eukprot:365052-Chlamydomonas_euryale.AAC.32
MNVSRDSVHAGQRRKRKHGLPAALFQGRYTAMHDNATKSKLKARGATHIVDDVQHQARDAYKQVARSHYGNDLVLAEVHHDRVNFEPKKGNRNSSRPAHQHSTLQYLP